MSWVSEHKDKGHDIIWEVRGWDVWTTDGMGEPAEPVEFMADDSLPVLRCRDCDDEIEVTS